uniref:Chemokine interleukin-8-like domain-containing protein n=1 Tax=Oreochromis niloticus TaxID=8128 RepID=A0A669BKD1_ORENI
MGLCLMLRCMAGIRCTRRRHPGRIPPCCPAVTKGNKRGDVVGETYREQAATPPCVKAIIFNTKDGQLCADPDAEWVKDRKSLTLYFIHAVDFIVF